MSFTGEQIRATRGLEGGGGGGSIFDTVGYVPRIPLEETLGMRKNGRGGGSGHSVGSRGRRAGERSGIGCATQQPEERKVRIDPADRLVAEQSSTL